MPSVDTTGFVVGLGQNNQNLDIQTNNRYLQKLEFSVLDSNTSPCNDLPFFNQPDAAYSVNYSIIICLFYSITNIVYIILYSFFKSYVLRPNQLVII